VSYDKEEKKDATPTLKVIPCKQHTFKDLSALSTNKKLVPRIFEEKIPEQPNPINLKSLAFQEA